MGYYSFNRPRRDGRLSWPCWLTDSGRLTHKVVKRPSINLAQDRENSPARTDVLTTILRHHSMFLILGVYSPWLLLAVSLTRHFQLLVITWLLHNVSYTRRIQWRAPLLAFLLNHSTFQLLDVSAFPLKSLADSNSFVTPCKICKPKWGNVYISILFASLVTIMWQNKHK